MTPETSPQHGVRKDSQEQPPAISRRSASTPRSDLRTARGSAGRSIPSSIPEMNRQLARRLRQLRLDHGLTQEKLAERAQVSPDAIRRLERGGFSPTLRMLAQLSHALSLPVSDLVAFGDAPREDRLLGLVSLLRGRSEQEIAMALRLVRAALIDRD